MMRYLKNLTNQYGQLIYINKRKEQHLLKECGLNLYKKVLLIIQIAIIRQNDAKKELLLSQAIQLIQQIKEQEHILLNQVHLTISDDHQLLNQAATNHGNVMPDNDDNDDKEARSLAIPTFISKTNHSITISISIPLHYIKQYKMKSYIICGKLTDGTINHIKSTDTTLSNCGKAYEIDPDHDYKKIHCIDNLKSNYGYQFAVYAINTSNQMIKNSLSRSTIVYYTCLPISLCDLYTKVADVADISLHDQIIQQCSDYVINYFSNKKKSPQDHHQDVPLEIFEQELLDQNISSSSCYSLQFPKKWKNSSYITSWKSQLSLIQFDQNILQSSNAIQITKLIKILSLKAKYIQQQQQQAVDISDKSFINHGFQAILLSNRNKQLIQFHIAKYYYHILQIAMIIHDYQQLEIYIVKLYQIIQPFFNYNTSTITSLYSTSNTSHTFILSFLNILFIAIQFYRQHNKSILLCPIYIMNISIQIIYQLTYFYLHYKEFNICNEIISYEIYYLKLHIKKYIEQFQYNVNGYQLRQKDRNIQCQIELNDLKQQLQQLQQIINQIENNQIHITTINNSLDQEEQQQVEDDDEKKKKKWKKKKKKKKKKK